MKSIYLALLFVATAMPVYAQTPTPTCCGAKWSFTTDLMTGLAKQVAIDAKFGFDSGNLATIPVPKGRYFFTRIQCGFSNASKLSAPISAIVDFRLKTAPFQTSVLSAQFVTTSPVFATSFVDKSIEPPLFIDASSVKSEMVMSVTAVGHVSSADSCRAFFIVYP
jgi:hypothetical protein